MFWSRQLVRPESMPQQCDSIAPRKCVRLRCGFPTTLRRNEKRASDEFTCNAGQCPKVRIGSLLHRGIEGFKCRFGRGTKRPEPKGRAACSSDIVRIAQERHGGSDRLLGRLGIGVSQAAITFLW